MDKSEENQKILMAMNESSKSQINTLKTENDTLQQYDYNNPWILSLDDGG